MFGFIGLDSWIVYVSEFVIYAGQIPMGAFVLASSLRIIVTSCSVFYPGQGHISSVQ